MRGSDPGRTGDPQHLGCNGGAWSLGRSFFVRSCPSSPPPSPGGPGARVLRRSSEFVSSFVENSSRERRQLSDVRPREVLILGNLRLFWPRNLRCDVSRTSTVPSSIPLQPNLLRPNSLVSMSGPATYPDARAGHLAVTLEPLPLCILLCPTRFAERFLSARNLLDARDTNG